MQGRIQDLSQGWGKLSHEVKYFFAPPPLPGLKNYFILSLLHVPDSRTIYNNVPLHSSVFCSLLKTIISTVLCPLYSSPPLLSLCNLLLDFMGVAERHAKHLHNALSNNSLSRRGGGGR